MDCEIQSDAEEANGVGVGGGRTTTNKARNREFPPEKLRQHSSEYQVTQLPRLCPDQNSWACLCA